MLAKLLKEGADLLQRLSIEKLDAVSTWVRQQLVVNVLDVALINASAGLTIVEDRRDEILRFVEVGRTLQRERELPASTWDDLAEYIYWTAAAVFERDEGVRQGAVERVAALTFPVSNPFDSQRAKVFRNLALRRA
jgi:hypothetical protein